MDDKMWRHVESTRLWMALSTAYVTRKLLFCWWFCRHAISTQLKTITWSWRWFKVFSLQAFYVCSLHLLMAAAALALLLEVTLSTIQYIQCLCTNFWSCVGNAFSLYSLVKLLSNFMKKVYWGICLFMRSLCENICNVLEDRWPPSTLFFFSSLSCPSSSETFYLPLSFSFLEQTATKIGWYYRLFWISELFQI